MKKILALILAVMMILTAASALAENSKGNKDITGGDTGDEEIKLVKIDPTDKLAKLIEKIKGAYKDEGDALKGLPAELLALIPAEHKTINELTCWKLEGDVSAVKGELELIFKFESPYEEGEEVTILIGIDYADADAEVEWIVKTGVANKDGDVVVKVTAAELAKISNNPFIAIPVSK